MLLSTIIFRLSSWSVKHDIHFTSPSVEKEYHLWNLTSAALCENKENEQKWNENCFSLLPLISRSPFPAISNPNFPPASIINTKHQKHNWIDLKLEINWKKSNKTQINNEIFGKTIFIPLSSATNMFSLHIVPHYRSLTWVTFCIWYSTERLHNLLYNGNRASTLKQQFDLCNSICASFCHFLVSFYSLSLVDVFASSYNLTAKIYDRSKFLFHFKAPLPKAQAAVAAWERKSQARNSITTRLEGAKNF